ncbi:hypothetical protein B9N43_10850 [Denitratisoma sp. DHT3]|nr:hypothetical protein B9N43_10850 [Denitratisoma sp. DHT3]
MFLGVANIADGKILEMRLVRNCIKSKFAKAIARGVFSVQGGGIFVLLLLVVGIYLPGLTGGYEFDDFSSIVWNSALGKVSVPTVEKWLAIVRSGNASELGRPLAMLSFGLNVYFQGANPYGFKLTNILIHALNSLLVFGTARALLTLAPESKENKASPTLLAFCIAGLWAMHPIHVTSVLYVVQRMTSLAATFVFAALWAYLALRRAMVLKETKKSYLLSIVVVLLTVAGTLVKEIAFLVPLYLILVELMLHPGLGGSERGQRLALRALQGIGLTAVVFVLFKWSWFEGGYQIRGFTLYERVLTEFRVVWYYLWMLFTADIHAMGLHHDDFAISHRLLNPSTTLLSLVGVLGLVVGAWWGRKRSPLIAGGILFFCAAHSLESSILALDIAYDHRNYVPSLGLALALVVALSKTPLRSSPIIAGTVAIAIGTGLSLLTYERARDWGDPMRLAQVEAGNHPDSMRANQNLARMYWRIIDHPDLGAAAYTKAAYYLGKAANADPCNSLPTISQILMAGQARKPMPLAVLDKIAWQFASCPVRQDALSTYSAYVGCVALGQCEGDARRMTVLFDALASNPRVIVSHKADIAMAMADFMLVKRDFSQVESYLQAASQWAKAQREAQCLMLVDFWVGMGALDQAMEAIGYLRGRTKVCQVNEQALNIRSHWVEAKLPASSDGMR